MQILRTSLPDRSVVISLFFRSTDWERNVSIQVCTQVFQVLIKISYLYPWSILKVAECGSWMAVFKTVNPRKYLNLLIILLLVLQTILIHFNILLCHLCDFNRRIQSFWSSSLSSCRLVLYYAGTILSVFSTGTMLHLPFCMLCIFTSLICLAIYVIPLEKVQILGANLQKILCIRTL